jgi:hypothetical protein
MNHISEFLSLSRERCHSIAQANLGKYVESAGLHKTIQCLTRTQKKLCLHYKDTYVNCVQAIITVYTYCKHHEKHIHTLYEQK